jgi:hypothetical protein
VTGHGGSNVLARALSALPDAALGAVFLVTWVAPRLFGEGVLKYVLFTMLMEFFVVHSSGFMGVVLFRMSPSVVKRALAGVGFGLVYSAILLGFALSIGGWWPLWSFWGLTFNRLTNAILGGQAGQPAQARMANDWATSAAWYLLWLFSTLLPFPALGITPEVVASAGLPGEGLWVREPHRVLVAGAGYFLCQAWVELRGEALIKLKES